MLLELFAAALLMCGDDNRGNEIFCSSHKKVPRSGFEEADSYLDRDGNEHTVDDDGYCEDCDDYHDDF